MKTRFALIQEALTEAFKAKLDVELTSDELSAMSSPIGELVKLLDKLLGPQFPEDGLLTLTDDQFIRRYGPEANPHDSSYYRQREWDVPEDIAAIDAAIPENRVWTAVDDDEGRFCIIEGVHRVNRIYYLITSKPPEDASWHIQVYDEDDLEEINNELQCQAH